VAVSGPVSEFRLLPVVFELVEESADVDWLRVGVLLMVLLLALGFWGGVVWLVLG
jgi:hypothetical protein